MENRLNRVDMRQKYEELLDVFLNEPISIEGFLRGARKSAAILTTLIPIGQAQMELTAPSNQYLPQGAEDTFIIYEQKEWERELLLEKKFFTEEGGSVVFRFYPSRGNSFSREQKETLFYYMKLLYSFGGRARIGAMLKRALTSDSMTGLPTLDSFLKHIGKLVSLQRAGSYNAFYLNVKNFKYINKMVNYQIGDQVMVQYAHKLAAFTREDELVGRLGGDNYVALIRRERTEAFLSHISAIEVLVDMAVGVKPVTLSAVAGIYEIPDNLHNPGDVMMPVSVAFQAAKQVLHTSFAYYTPKLSQRILSGQKVAIDFSKSMRDGEFVIYLQPKVNLSTKQICRAEALARWIQNGNVIPPSEFVPALEKDGTICKLDFEMLRQTCVKIAEWKAAGKIPPRVSVNLSRWHLQNPNLVQDVFEIIDRYGVEPKYLEIELTETVNYEEHEIMTRFFKEFRRRGLSTSIDDFGTGYSSLNLLKNLEVDVLKLDKSFLEELGEGRKDRVLIETIIKMAKELDMIVLAEGVESTSQRDFLIQAHCDMAQGFLYARPLPVAEFERRAWK